MDTGQVGLDGEALAAAYLQSRGYVVLHRRYRFERAEIDLVCFEPRRDGHAGGELVFVEVKTRTSEAYGAPEEGLLPKQRRNILHAARAYLYERRLEGASVRFDMVAVSYECPKQRRSAGDDAPSVRHYKHAFTG